MRRAALLAAAIAGMAMAEAQCTSGTEADERCPWPAMACRLHNMADIGDAYTCGARSDVRLVSSSTVSAAPRGKPDDHNVKLQIESKDPKGERRKHGGDYYLVTLRGPAVAQAVVRDIGDGTYEATASLWVPGTYAIRVMLLFSQLKCPEGEGQCDSLINSTFSGCIRNMPKPAPGKCYNNIRACVFRTLGTAELKGLGANVANMTVTVVPSEDASAAVGSMPVCTHSNIGMGGQWVRANKGSSDMDGGVADVPFVERKKHKRAELWHWSPPHCDLRRLSPRLLKACGRYRRIILSGDSVTREFMEDIKFLNNGKPPKNFSFKRLLPTKTAAGLTLLFQQARKKGMHSWLLGKDGADAVVLNSGLHDIVRMPPDQYKDALLRLAPMIQALTRRGIPVVWRLTTAPAAASDQSLDTSLRSTRFGTLRACRYEQRLDRIEILNALARAILTPAGARIADVFAMTRTAPTSWYRDNVHHSLRGLSASAAELVLNTLC